MIVVTPSGTITLGAVEVAPTIGITDYSRRVTDDFGVTTVVPRGFSRRMAVRLALPSDQVDGLQQTLADLRATAASWVADDRFRSLTVFGFYKDFSIDIANGAISYCTLTIEGLAETADAVVSDIDPAPDGQASSLLLVQPVVIDDTTLVASNVDEDDAPAWSASATYATGATVIRQHRVYESLVNGNVGVDPVTDASKWLDTGPTNRWRMFDQALGSATTRPDPVSVTLHSEKITAIALLDVVAATVRVQVSSYDMTLPVVDGTVVFQDVPPSGNDIVVAASGPGTVSIGTLLAGTLVTLGVTEASPSAGITDYSRKETDDFGNVTVVPRAWAKRMSTRALIRTDAIDDVASRIAAVRAQPSLWIGQSGRNSLTVYGFFKDFSIEVGQTVSKLSLTIEGLSKAAAISPIIGQPGRDGVDGKDGKDGRDGLNGSDGAPGSPGADGRTSYVHYAYANSPDGRIDFDLNQPNGRAYEGSYTDFTALDSSDPAAYTWREYKGPAAFGLAGTGNGIVAGASIVNVGSLTEWGYAGGYSTEGWARGAQTSFALDSGAIAGLNTDPTSDAGFASIDYAFFVSDGGTYIVESSEIVAGPVSNDFSRRFQISYDNRTVRYLINGVLQREVAAPPGLTLYFDAGLINGPGNKVREIAFGTAGSSGSDGRDGLNGTNGAPGRDGINGGSAYFHVAYANSADGSVDFTTGAPGARTYLGVAVDQNAADPETFGSYAWSLIKGRDGLNGNDGTPGARGADGRQSYVHFAYANSADGSASFSTDDPSGRAYIGVYSDYTLADSTDYRSYTWSLAKGADGNDGISIITSPTAFTIPSYSNGATKPEWTGGSCRIALIKGGQEVTADSYTYVNAQNIASIGMSGQSVTFADIIGNKAEFTARAVRNGVAFDQRVTITRPLDGSDAFRATASFASSINSATGTGSATVPGGRVVTVSASATYDAQQNGEGRGVLAIYWQNASTNGPMNYLGQMTGSSATNLNVGTIENPVYERKPGSVSVSGQFTSPSPDSQITYQAVFTTDIGTTVNIAGTISLGVSQ